MKKYFLSCVLMLMFIATACASDAESIEGYWMAEDGETISFDANGGAIVEDILLDYVIYGENNLVLSLWGFATEYSFEIEENTLSLTELETNVTKVYYRDEATQTKIRENLKLIAEVQAEQQKEAEYVEKLRDTIRKIDSEIWSLESWIEREEVRISDTHEYVASERDTISEIEGEIAELQREFGQTDSDKLEQLREQQEQHYERIELYIQDIADAEDEIIQYRKNVEELKAHREDVLKELEKVTVN